MQDERYLNFDLHGIYQLLLQPVIEQGGGYDIEFTGDAVSARFRSHQSAIKAGFAIHKALSTWNRSHRGPALAVRVGINTGCDMDSERQQHLSLVAADHLQSLGRADTVCVSSPKIDEIKPAFPVYVHSLGAHVLTPNQRAIPVYYFFDKMPGLATRQKLFYNSLKNRSAKKVYRFSPLFLAFILVAVGLFLFTTDNPVKNIEIAEIENYSQESFKPEISSISHFLATRLSGVPGINLLSSSDESIMDIRLICSFQHDSGQVRLTWGLLLLEDGVQVLGGDVTGDLEDLAMLEKQLVESILFELNRG